MERYTEDLFNSRISSYLNREYSGSYSTSLELDYENQRAYLSIAFEDADSFPAVGEFLEEISEELRIEEPAIRSSFQEPENIYSIELTKSRG